MRAATLLVGTFLIGSLSVTVFTGLDRPRLVSLPQHVAALVVGCLMLVLWIAAVAAVVWFPGVAMVLYVVAAALGLAGSRLTDVDELVVWAGLSGALAVTSYLGHRGKRSVDRRARVEAAERTRQRLWADYLAATEFDARVQGERRQAELAQGTVPAPTPPPADPAQP